MDFSQQEYTLQARPSATRNIPGALRRVFVNDPGLVLQVVMTIPIILASFVLNLSVLQWIVVIFVTALFLLAGIFRTAALLQADNDSSLSPFHVNRIKCTGNGMVVITAGLSMFTYMIVFIPKILQIL